MSQVEWQIVKDVFYTALNRPPAERSDFLDSACGQNNPLRSEVEFLLESYESGFLESPILADKEEKRGPDEPLFTRGREFGQYEILRMIGRGGMGEVYLANDTKLERLAAIKVIHGNSGFGDQSAERLIREARSAAKLDHPNICSVYEIGETDGHPYIAMQYVEGCMLDALLEKGSISFDDAVSYTRQIAAGLAKAHSRGIVHRDIKPSNIIIDVANHLKILDFGLAKETIVNPTDIDLSVVGLIAGTVTYMSPEHARGHAVDGRTDVWSLGVVFYQMLTGRLPFRGDTKADLISAILNDEIADAGDVPPAVKYILDRALQKDISLRYASIEEFDADLAELVKTGSVSQAADHLSTTTLPAIVPDAGNVPNRGYLIRYALPVLLLLVLAGGGFGVWRYRSASASAFSGKNFAALPVTTLFDVKRHGNGFFDSFSFSPDGTKIAFSQSGNGTHGVYVQSLDSNEPVRLTAIGAINYAPVWSADGQRLAYMSFQDGKGSIWSITTSGQELVKLADLGAYSARRQLRKWTNDGKAIFIEEADGVSKIDLTTGNITAIDMTGVVGDVSTGITISPDDKKMLIPTSVDGKFKLWVKTIGTNDAKCLIEDYSRNGTPAFFPDNQRFTFSSNITGSYQLYTMSLDETAPVQITFGQLNITDPAVSPDGNHLVYVTSKSEANLYASDIGTLKETAITSKTTLEVLPAISPDGRQIAYESITSEELFLRGSIRIQSPNGDGTSKTTTLNQSGHSLQWLPNGNEIAYVHRIGSKFSIWKVDLNDQRYTQIADDIRGPSGANSAPIEISPEFNLSPDGSQVVFVSKRTSQENIWKANTDGSGETSITQFDDGTTKASDPMWSPNGDRVAFIEAIGPGRIEARGNKRIAVLKDGHITIVGEFDTWTDILGWFNDGTGIYASVQSGDYFDIYFVPVDNSGLIRKARLLTERGLGIRLSPDQKWIAYTETRDDVDNLYLSPLDGGSPTPVTANTDTNIYYSGVTWSPDSKTLLYSKQTGGMQISMTSNTQ